MNPRPPRYEPFFWGVKRGVPPKNTVLLVNKGFTKTCQAWVIQIQPGWFGSDFFLSLAFTAARSTDGHSILLRSEQQSDVQNVHHILRIF